MKHSDETRKALPLRGARVLVVEDEFIIMLELTSLLEDRGAEVVGPFAGIQEALAAVQAKAIDVAILDLRLGDSGITPVARELSRRGIPFMFYTGQTKADPLLAEWSGCKVVAKPAEPALIIGALTGLLSQARDRRAKDEADNQRLVLP